MLSALKRSVQTTNLPAALPLQALGSFTILLFDIDGVIRDVAGSYRRALQETVAHYSGWRPDASDIDRLKAEGSWNTDWDASLELLRRRVLGEPVPHGGGAVGLDLFEIGALDVER